MISHVIPKGKLFQKAKEKPLAISEKICRSGTSGLDGGNRDATLKMDMTAASDSLQPQLNHNGLEARALTILFRRDPSRDRQRGAIRFHGYQILWPDGARVDLAFDAFCQHAQRLLGLSRHLDGHQERLVELLCFPVPNRDQDMTKLPGYRVRRFHLRRNGTFGRIHFLDGTPTEAVSEISRDDRRILEWIGLIGLPPQGEQWFDLAARPVDSPAAS
jgi:hypothetical protein